MSDKFVLPGSRGKIGREKKKTGVTSDVGGSSSFVSSSGDADVEAPSAALMESWVAEQERLRAAIIERDDHSDWGADGVPELIGGLDISFVEKSKVDACASLVVLRYPSLQVVHEAFEMVRLTAPYVSGFLAFREAPFLVALLEKLRATKPELVPSLLVLDGNGVHHPRGCGIASHLGVLANIPTIGVAKKLLEVDGMDRARAEALFESQCTTPGSHVVMVGGSGRTLGAIVRSPTSTHPLFVSVGHRVSLATAINVVLKTCVVRIPEPTRQADLRSREFLRENFTKKPVAAPAPTVAVPSTSSAPPAAAAAAGPKRDSKEDRIKLLLAADSGNIAEVTALLDGGVSVNTPVDHPKFNHRSTAILYASRSGHIEIVKLLLSRGADPNLCDIEDWNSLYYAVNSGHTEIARLLLAAGADKEKKDNFAQRTPLDVAKHRQFHDIVGLLGGDPSDKSYHRSPEEIAAAAKAEKKGVMRGVHFKAADLFMGRYMIDEEDVSRISRYRDDWRTSKPLQIVALDAVLENKRVMLRFTHDRAAHDAEMQAKAGTFVRSGAISTNDFMLVTARASK